MSSVIDFVSESLKRNPLPRQVLREELPSGWKKIESRTKPGTYYYAHPATNRTQVAPPSGTKQVPTNGEDRKSSGKAAEDEEAARKNQLAEKDQERKRKYQEVEDEAEAEEELVEEEKRRIKAAKKAKELEQKRKAEEAARLEKERKELEAKMEKERLQREAEERKRQQELEALAEEKRKKEAEHRKKEQEAQRRKAMVFEQHSILQKKLAEDARKKQAEEEEEKKRKAAEEKTQQKEQKNEAEEAERKAKAERLDAKIWNQKIPDTTEATSSPCFEVYKSGKLQRTHTLSGDKSSWIIGRGPAGVDIAIGNQRISRKHAEVTSQGPLLFLNDLGSTYGTAMNKEKLEAKSPVELINGARFRFGGLPELYVYREPVEEEEEPSSPPIEAEVTGTAMAEDEPDLPPPEPVAAPVAPQIDAAQAAAEKAKAAEEAEAEDEARIKRIQQKRQERKAAEAAEKAQLAAKKEEERKKKQERNQKKRAAKEAKAAKKAAQVQASRSKPGTETADLLPGDATPPDAPLPESCMASPPEEEPEDLQDVHLGRNQDAANGAAEAKSIDFF